MVILLLKLLIVLSQFIQISLVLSIDRLKLLYFCILAVDLLVVLLELMLELLNVFLEGYLSTLLVLNALC